MTSSLGPRFEPIAWSHGWKVLDWHTGRYVPRIWDTRTQATRYASRRNRAHVVATAQRFRFGPGGEFVPIDHPTNVGQ